MTIREIVQDYLRGLRYDGLANVWNQCGCGTDDFMPCESPEFAGVYACQPAYRWTCPKDVSDCEAVDDGAYCECHPTGCYQPQIQP